MLQRPGHIYDSPGDQCCEYSVLWTLVKTCFDSDMKLVEAWQSTICNHLLVCDLYLAEDTRNFQKSCIEVNLLFIFLFYSFSNRIESIVLFMFLFLNSHFVPVQI